MADDKDKKGFSGLLDLASEVDTFDESLSSEPQTEEKKHLDVQSEKSSSKEPPRSDPEKKPEDSPPFLDPHMSNWFFWPFILINRARKTVLVTFISALFLIWLFSDENPSKKNQSYDPPSSAQNISYPQNNPNPTVSNPSTSQRAEITYTKPSVGTDNFLSEPQIRWCLREGIRIEAMRDVIYTSEGIYEFNRIVDDYNRRCSSYRYYQNSYSRAERDVEASRNQIASKAIQEAKQLDQSIASTHSDPYTPSAQYTKEAQQLLKTLGYDPGPIDGIYGQRTGNAVEAFQRDIGIIQDGRIDQNLLIMLRRVKAAYKPPAVPQTKTQGKTSAQPRSSIPSVTTAFAGYFTRGSHQDEVLRVQGKPDDINDYAVLGYHEWRYGYSSIKLSTRDRRVLSWNNQGNLKVRLLPGDNVTSSTSFTRGSHQDEVLKIQGTPDDINDYSVLGYEEWKYGYSSIKISNRDRRVQSWTNQGNLNVQLQPGSETTNAPVFTRGSHQDDVLRVQGTPDDINDYSALGYEEWKYGYSSVKILTQNRRVISWTNQGNLKVRLVPGSNTTSSRYFTHNSHQDDVLRLQGTPDDINEYSALGYEEWSYGYSSVKISTRGRQVVGWDNNSGTLKAR